MIAPWLVSHGFPANANLQADPNGDGVGLLIAYALNLDPNQNLRGSLPRPVTTANQMGLTFYPEAMGLPTRSSAAPTCETGARRA